jgi:hypothetical protein
LNATVHHPNRWIRGFSRVGLVLACIAAVGILAIGAIIITTEVSQPRDYEYNKRACLLAENANRRLEGAEFKAKADASQCGYFSPYATYRSLQWQEYGRSINENGFLLVRTSDEEIRARVQQAITWTVALAGAAFAVTFLLCWLMGWIFAGFAKS